MRYLRFISSMKPFTMNATMMMTITPTITGMLHSGRKLRSISKPFYTRAAQGALIG